MRRASAWDEPYYSSPEVLTPLADGPAHVSLACHSPAAIVMTEGCRDLSPRVRGLPDMAGQTLTPCPDSPESCACPVSLPPRSS